ncbi:MAG: adenylosuccinate lyase [Simkaniaceae bacterium]|nr:MAG: adenylosuccinate lyase [Simkaniaceae bacterium]
MALVYETPLSTRYASPEMKEVFSSAFKYRTWRKLWVALAEGEKELGISISDAQIEELRNNVDNIDFIKVRSLETKLRHEVMAHIEAFGEVCPNAKGIIHMGATSSYVMDNGDLIAHKTALQLIKNKLILLIEKLNHISLKEAETPCLGYTHFQPAQATTFGKRSALWLHDFIRDFKDQLFLMEDFPFLGCKGAIGTSGSFLALFEGDHQKVIALDDLITKKMGFKKSFLVSSQTFPRKQEQRILSLLAGIATSAHKCATDLRLLSHLGEVEEPFGKDQVGSSAMPYKRNPIFSERVCGLSRFIVNLWHNTADNAALQWLERSLDDSSNRRITIPEAFLAADSVVNLLYTIIDGLQVYPKLMESHLKERLPYIATEALLAAAVLKGKDRQETHALFKKLSFEAAQTKKETGMDSDLLKTLLDAVGLKEDELGGLLEVNNLTGRSKEQVIEFLKLEVEPLLEKHFTADVVIPNIEV